MNEDIRETYHSAEYDEYYASLDAKTKAKYDYVETIIKTQYVVNKKFVKNLEGTEFYEARISVGTNEREVILEEPLRTGALENIKQKMRIVMWQGW